MSAACPCTIAAGKPDPRESGSGSGETIIVSGQRGRAHTVLAGMVLTPGELHQVST